MTSESLVILVFHRKNHIFSGIGRYCLEILKSTRANYKVFSVWELVLRASGYPAICRSLYYAKNPTNGIPRMILVFADETMCILALIMHLLGVPVAVVIHDVRPLKFYPHNNSILSRFIALTRWIFVSIGLRASLLLELRLIAASATTYIDLQRMKHIRTSPGRLFLLPNVCHDAYISSRALFDVDELRPRNDYTVLLVSSNEHRKRLHLLPEIIATCENVTRFILVTGSIPCELSSACGSKLTVISHASSLTSVYRSADALLHLSEYEGYGRPIMEALLFGLDVVATSETYLLNFSGLPITKISADPHLIAKKLDELACCQFWKPQERLQRAQYALNAYMDGLACVHQGLTDLLSSF